MAYVNVYPQRINWENEPSINTPINDVNLNKIDYAVYEHDRTLANWDTTKANQSDLLLSVKTIEYDDETGVFVFTWQNGTTKTVDLNIEKIPVSFSMNEQGVITMTTDDGTQYTADVGALIKTYTFTDSSVIDFTVTTDGSGNKTITADIVDGSITGTKLQPNYLADCTAAKTAAENAETGAEDNAEDAEAWAVGERGGVPVDPTDPTYHNNSKYWSEQANVTTLSALTDTDIDNPADGQVLTYDGATSKWENKTPAAGGGSKITITTSELSLIGTTATLTDGVTTLSADFDNSGKAVFEGVTMTGTLTVTATNGVDTATKQITIQYYGNYTFVIAFFSATITITFPYTEGGTCTVSDGVSTLTATTSPMAFVVPNTGTWVATCTLDGQSKTQSFVITTDGQTESHTFEYGEIDLIFDNEFRGLNITCVNGGTVITKQAPIAGNSMTFYPPSTGEWTISGTYSGVPYSTSATIVSLSTSVSAILQTAVVATVTLHGAAGATITYTDANGLQTQTLDSSGEKANVSIAVPPNKPIIVFEDTTVSKNPADLTANYKKAVAVSDTLTDIYVMPSNVLYWWGFEDSNLEDCTSANGWSAGGKTFSAPTHNTNSIRIAGTTNDVQGVASKTTVSAVANTTKVISICTGITIGSGLYGSISWQKAKNLDTGNLGVEDVVSSSLTKYECAITGSGNYYPADIAGWNTRVFDLYAFWYNTSGDYNFYSAANDVVTFKDANNNDIVFAITDENGGAYIDYTALPSGSYTLTSSVAKNPSDLTADYSKTVSITNATTEVYLMPSNVLYWYGYFSNNCEDITSANGWTGYSTLIEPDHNINSISKENVNYNSGIGSKTAVSATSAYCIGYGVGDNTSLTNSSSKALSSYIKTQKLNGVATPTLASITGLTGNTYISVWGNLGSSRNIFVNALWYE